MDVEAIVARIWPGEEPRVEVLGGGITNHNFKVDAAGGPYVLRIAGRDTDALGIDRSVEHEAALAAAAVGVGPEVVAFVEPEGYLVTRFIEGSIVPARAHARAGVDQARGPRASRGPSRAVAPGALHLVPGRRGLPHRRRSRTAPRSRRATPGRARSRGGSSGRGVRSPSVPATTTCSTRTSSTTASASGSSTGSTRAWATSSSISRTSRSTTVSAATAARRAPRGVLRRGPRTTRARPRADAVHVGLPRGDVGRVQGASRSSTSTSAATPPSTSSAWRRPPRRPRSSHALESA